MYGELGIKTIVSTHDRKEYDQDLERKEFHIAVVVFEKLNALLVKNPNLLEGIGLVVIDELQMMGDESRGAGLELLLTKILGSPFRPQILGFRRCLETPKISHAGSRQNCSWKPAGLWNCEREYSPEASLVIWNTTAASKAKRSGHCRWTMKKECHRFMRPSI